MKTKLFAPLLLALLSTFNLQLSAFGQGTAFTYQGRLNDGTAPANGTYDLRFTLFDTLTFGSAVAGPLTNASTGVSKGVFTVALDFGSSAFPGPPRWLEIGVCSNGSVGPYSTLSPRQALTPSPYAIAAGSLTGLLPGGNLSGAYSNAVTFNNASNGFTGNGAALTALNAGQLASGTVADARLSPNVALLNANQTFTGTNTFADARGKFSGNGSGLTGLNLNLNSGGAIQPAGAFSLGSSPAVGFGPSFVVVADVNGDGRPDLISANEAANTLTVLTNNGSGGFAIASSPTVGPGPLSVAAVDVNGDGKADLICANGGANTLTVLTNNGSGGFVLAATLAVGNSPASVVAADVNGDGKPDLISANLNDSTLTILTNDGSGGFVLASAPGVGSFPLAVVAADVNGDGKLDLICANSGANTLTVLTNNGSGGFVLAAALAVGITPTSVAAADVNADGRLDLVSANFGENTLTILTNNGTGGFVPASSPSVGIQPYSVAAADLNGDGRLDLISANLGANTLSVLTNNGSGGFVLASSPGVGAQPYAVAAADLNGDGRVDLIAANHAANTLSVLFSLAQFNGALNWTLTGPLPSGNLFGTYSNALTLNNASDVLAGNGAALTALNASQLASGTITDARLSTNVALRNANQTFSGTNTFADARGHFSGDGAGLSALNATQLASGTIADARLSTNVAVRAGGNTFTGDQNVTNGNVGIGTTSPQDLFNVNGNVRWGGTIADFASSGEDGSGLFLEQHGSSLAKSTIRLQSSTAGDLNNYSQFFIDPANGFSFMSLGTGNGNVGIGTKSPSAGDALDVNGTAWIRTNLYVGYYPNGYLQVNGGGRINGYLEVDNGLQVNSLGANGVYLNCALYANDGAYKPGGGSWSSSSDERLKQNIQPLTGVLDQLLALRGVSFEFKEPEKIHELPGERIGMIAQEVEKVFPDWVETGADGFKRLTYRGFEALTVEALRELRAEKDAKVRELEERSLNLQARLERLERLMNEKNGRAR